MSRDVRSERAEVARTELMYTLAAHQRWRRTRVFDFGRLSVLRTVSAPQSIEHLTMPHIAAVAEEFARATLLEASEPLVPQANKLLRILWERAEAHTEQWRGIEEAWDKWHGINVRTEPRYKTFKGVVEARNAIVHGLGRLTKKQTRGDGGAKVRTSLALVGITTAGSRLVLTDECVRRSVEAARVFIEWLDRESTQRGLRPLRGAL